MTDFFLTHDWGKDNIGRDNHDRVSKVNDMLKELGFQTWFDSDRMSGDIFAQMAEGIESTKVVLVFLTQRYMDKVTGSNTADNCKLEFEHVRILKSVNMIAVVMESSMTRTADWKGALGLHLGNKLYVNMTGNVNDPAYLKPKIKELHDIIQSFPNMQAPGVSARQLDIGQPSKEELTREQKGNEIKATRAKSSRGQIKYTVQFTNNHDEEVDLIWKNYEGGEVVVRQGIAPGAVHAESSFYTHPFIARDIITERVCYFSAGDKRGVVFEGMNFGAPSDGGRIHVSIE